MSTLLYRGHSYDQHKECAKNQLSNSRIAGRSIKHVRQKPSRQQLS